MKAMTLRLPDEVHEALRQRAFGQRTSITEIVRQAIDERLTWIDAESSSWCADCRFEEGDNPACCAALAAVPADVETEWEYGIRYTKGGIEEFEGEPLESIQRRVAAIRARRATGGSYAKTVRAMRRRPAGDPEPIPEGSAD